MKSNKEIINLEEISNESLQYLIKIRRYFYDLTKLLTNQDINNNNIINDKAKILQQILEKMKEYLETFSSIDKYDISVSKLFLAYANNSIPNKNSNYKILNNHDLSAIYNTFTVNLFNLINKQKTYSSFIYNPPITEGKQEQLDFKEIINKYIKAKKYNHISINYRNNDKIQNINSQISLFNLYLEISSNKNDEPISEIKIYQKYRPFDNTLLIKQLEEEIIDIVQRISNRLRRKEISIKDYLSKFIDYIQDLDKIFYIKCVRCKKHSKYSFKQKAFLPPFIKFNFEKYAPLHMLLVSKESLFYHPQCIS